MMQWEPRYLYIIVVKRWTDFCWNCSQLLFYCISSLLIHYVSEKTSPFLFLWYLCQISSDFANFWQKLTSGNLKQTHIHGPIYIPFYMFILYLVKTSDAWQRTLQRRPLPVRLVIKPESCNFFKRLSKPLTFQPLSENSWTNFLAPKTLNLYTFFTKCDNSKLKISNSTHAKDKVHSYFGFSACFSFSVSSPYRTDSL